MTVEKRKSSMFQTQFAASASAIILVAAPDGQPTQERLEVTTSQDRVILFKLIIAIKIPTPTLIH